MAELDLEAGNAAAWFAGQELPGEPVVGRPAGRRRRPRMHLVVGDSIARRAGLGSRFPGDRMLSRARSSETWGSLLDQISYDLRAWQIAAEAEGLTPGAIIIWLTGNDVYGPISHLRSFDDEKLLEIGRLARRVIGSCGEAAREVIVLGPLPRTAGELGPAIWQETASYKLERTLIHQPGNFKFVTLGQALTRKVGRNLHALAGVDHWFKDDGIHLSRAGYGKLAEAGSLPIWLTLSAADRRR